jgi:hypothetical protein
MHPHDGHVDHLDSSIMSGSKGVHDPAPYSGPSPPDETVVAGRAWTIAIRQIAPWRAGSQHPTDAVEDASIVHTGDASHLVRQHRPDGSPFIVREFVAHDSRLHFGSLNRVQGGNQSAKVLTTIAGMDGPCPRSPLSRLTPFRQRGCIATAGILFDWRSRRGGAG